MELAHGVGRIYQSPIPISYYLTGAALTVLASFFIRAAARKEGSRAPRRVWGSKGAGILLGTVRAYFLSILGLVITFAVVYSNEGGLGLAPLTFWICLIILPIILCSVWDGLWPAASPWRTLEGLYRYDEPGGGADRRPAPWWLPPVLVYALFWFELISGKGFDPVSLLVVVVGYTAYVLVFQRSSPWSTEQSDPLGILFGFAQRIAPLEVRRDGVYYRGFSGGLDQKEPMPMGLFLAVFIVLASTTLDNVRETVEWFDFQKAFGLETVDTRLLDSVALLGLAIPFLAPFLVCVSLARRWAAEPLAWGRTARLFGWSLIPIGIAYVLAHNMPLVVIGLPSLVQQFAEGFGLQAFGEYSPSPLLVWIIEIGLIVGGHVIGVLAAHNVAVRIAGSHRAAFKSHVALTLLMSVFTISTLWLLSLPIVTS